MCFPKSRSSKDEDETLLAPRPISVSDQARISRDPRSDDNHHAIALKTELQRQKEIRAALDALDDLPDASSNATHSSPAENFTPHDQNYRQSPTRSTKGPPTTSPTPPNPSKHLPPPHHTPAGPSIPVTRQAAPPSPPLKPRKQEQKYTVLPTRPSYAQPPLLDYSRYEIWDKVQKENHAIGGRDLEWKTGVVDLRIEADLTDQYIAWVRERREELRVEGELIRQNRIEAGAWEGGGKGLRSVNRRDRRFFAKLENSLQGDFRQTARETYRHDDRFGKEMKDSSVIWDLVERLEREEEERKAKERAGGMR